MHSLSIVSALLIVAACGGSSHPATPAPTPAAKVAWKDMDADQRHAFMEDVVMPRSKELFMAFDADRYQDMDCKTDQRAARPRARGVAATGVAGAAPSSASSSALVVRSAPSVPSSTAAARSRLAACSSRILASIVSATTSR